MTVTRIRILSFLKMALVAVSLTTSFFFWARPGLVSGELSAWAAFLGVALATAAPVIALHFGWQYIARKNRQEARNNNDNNDNNDNN